MSKIIPYKAGGIYHDDCITKLPKENVLKYFGGLDSFISFHQEKLDGGILPEFER